MWLCHEETGCSKGQSTMFVALEKTDHPRVREMGQLREQQVRRLFIFQCNQNLKDQGFKYKNSMNAVSFYYYGYAKDL